MQIEQEPFLPDKALLQLVEEATEGISPDVSSLSKWHRAYVRNQKDRIALDLRIIKGNLKPEANILEIGSIPLLLTAALARLNYTVTGVDIAPHRYAAAIQKLGLQVLACDIERERLPVPDHQYDAVVFFEVFEHLRINPVFTLREVYRVLKPHGILFLSSPNLKSINGWKNYLLRDRAYSCSGDMYEEFMKLETLGHMGHIREYTKTEVIDFLRKVGFETYKLIYRGRTERRVHDWVLRVMPSLRPFITYVARKR